LATDLFIYVGALERAFEGVARVLQADGVLVFSVEIISGASFKLRPSGRYGHSEKYLRDLCEVNGLAVQQISEIDLRQENDAVIAGALFLCAKAPSFDIPKN
jgi:predicted TPR repeat methyltransferase